MPSLETRLRKACNEINRVLLEARKEHPNACLYFDATGNMNLMSGPHHDDCTNSETPVGHSYAKPERILCGGRINADCGDW